MTRLRVVVALVAVSALSACGSSGARSTAEHEFVDQLVGGGLDRTVAQCVADEFFDGRSDDELKAFFDRPELTDDERAEFARLAAGCTPD